MTRPTFTRCAACERERDDVTLVATKVHGPLPLCASCEDFCRSRGWLAHARTGIWQGRGAGLAKLGHV